MLSFIKTGLLAAFLLIGMVADARAAGSISGNVSTHTAPPVALPDTVVEVFDLFAGSVVAFATTDASGNYTASIPAGTYAIFTQDPHGYLNEVYNDIHCAATCDPSAGASIVVANSAVTGIDFTLDPGGRIAGTITQPRFSPHQPILPVPGVGVQLFNAAGDLAGTTISDSSGVYLSDGLPAGTYYARTAVPFSLSAYQNQLYNLIPCDSCMATTGTPIVVTTGVTHGGVDFSPLTISPTVETMPATGVAASEATLNGRISRNQRPITVYFDYGPVGSYYSNQVMALLAPGSDTSPVAMTAAITGLSPHTLYHFRAVVNFGVLGEDLVFGTGAAIGPVSNVLTGINTPITVPVAASAADGPGGLALSASSSNPTLVSNSNLRFSGSGVNRALTMTPAANQKGATTITVSVSDSTDTASTSFVLLVGVPPRGDFNGDGKADVLWRHSSGAATIFRMSGTQLVGDELQVGTVDPAWQIVGTGDYNGDGFADLLWRHTSGIVTVWLLNDGRVIGGGQIASIDPDWQIVGSGDYNGDGASDILWRNSSGKTTMWLMAGSQVVGGGEVGTVDPAWQIVGSGDYNGDGDSDILWRHGTGAVTIWLMKGTQVIGGGQVGAADPAWRIVGTADYNGDGRADLLWWHGSGATTIWLMNGEQVIGGGQVGTVDPAWRIVGTGDYSGDGRADILWRHSSTGAVTMWFTDGSQVVGGGPAIGMTDPDQQIVNTP